MDLPFRDLVDVLLRYHNSQVWEAVSESDLTVPRIKAEAAREIIKLIELRLETEADRQTFREELKRRYDATRESLYFRKETTQYQELGE